MKMLTRLAIAFTFLAGAQIAAAQTGMIDGEVTRIDQSANKITLRHGPIKKLGMDEGMTMVFATKDPGLLSGVKAGDKVRFDAEKVNGQFTVTKLEKR